MGAIGCSIEVAKERMVFVGGGDNMCVYVYERIHAETIKAGKNCPRVSLPCQGDSILSGKEPLESFNQGYRTRPEF